MALTYHYPDVLSPTSGTYSGTITIILDHELPNWGEDWHGITPYWATDSEWLWGDNAWTNYTFDIQYQLDGGVWHDVVTDYIYSEPYSWDISSFSTSAAKIRTRVKQVSTGEYGPWIESNEFTIEEYTAAAQLPGSIFLNVYQINKLKHYQRPAIKVFEIRELNFEN